MAADEEERLFIRLEFDRVLEALATKTTCVVGRELALALRPSARLEEVARCQRETSEAREVVRLHPEIPLGGIRDIREALLRAKRGGTLEAAELLAVAGTQRASRRLKDFWRQLEGDYPLLKARAEGLQLLPRLEAEVARCLDDQGAVLDRASPGLSRARRQVAGLQGRIRRTLEGILRDPVKQKLFQEPIITQRNDRYVLPVKQEFRQQFPGLVHDQSASGATLFIEPMALVDLNNELRRWQATEKQEVAAVLQQLSALVGGWSDELAQNLGILADLDLALAKGQLSLEQNACQPELNQEGRLRLIGARHPLIDATKVVPLSLELGYDFTILLITGPNTGGKTVALKTVGLLTLMAAAGLHLPAEPGSEVAVFHHLAADIGDEQSLEQSLSTFSAHLKNIITLLPLAGPHTLVLLDEIGAGTDPTEGAALAMALLDYLLERGARVVATSHFSELKAYAHRCPAIENASVEFDSKTLSPTYRLRLGLPGKSNALEIGARLGLNPGIVARARSYLGQEQQGIAELLTGLEEDRRLLAEEYQQAAALRRDLEQGQREMEVQLQELARRKEEELKAARAEALELVCQTKERSEELIAHLQRRGQELTAGAEREAFRETRRGLAELEQELRRQQTVATPRLPTAAAGGGKRDLVAGERVLVLSLGQKGTLLGPANAQGEVQVQLGGLRVTVAADQVEGLGPASAPDNPPQPRGGEPRGTTLPEKPTVGGEVHLRGLTVDEALAVLDQYLDQAYLAGWHYVRIIHGKGTGTLRRAVSDYLRHNSRVKSFRLGLLEEGGLGVTVAEL